ncbi:MAG: hypothetical protein HY470_00460 [Candidatus Ryanbacteria bacterium]|nr:hypothetical protein [Candidatus Ryanbacteria bacterium]
MTLKALGWLVGMIVGAGMFALPYAVVRSGVFWGSVHFVLAASLVTAGHLLYGSVCYRINERHRLPGFVREYLGKTWYAVALVSRLFAYFGYQLAYGVLGGIFLMALFPDISPALFTVGFFVLTSPLLYLNLKAAGTINLWFTVPIIFFVLVLFVVALPSLQMAPSLPTPSANWFFPYGIFLFAFSGMSVIPDIVDLFGRKNPARFRKVVVLGTLIVAIIYILFIASMVALADGFVSEDAISSLSGWLVPLGALLGLFAILTSYFALGIELRLTFEYDMHISRLLAWEAVVAVPLLLFLLGVSDFVAILSIVGAVGVGVEGVLVALLARSTRVAGSLPAFALSAVFVTGVALELAYIAGIFS